MGVNYITYFPLTVNMSTTRNNSKTCGDNVSLLTDTVHSLEVSQEFHFKKLDTLIEKVINNIHIFLFNCPRMNMCHLKTCEK